MQLNIKHITLLISLCAALTACSEQEVVIENNTDGKTPIELSSGKANSQTPTTRAVVIDGQGKITAFEKDTRLHMLMISQKGSTSDTKWTVTYGLAQGCGKAPVDLTDGENSSPISFDETSRCSQTYTDPANELDLSKRTVTDNNAYEGSWRYWDDAFARDAKVSVYGMCVANTVLANGAPWNQKINGVKSNATPVWTDDASSVDFVIGREDGSGNRITWTVGKHDDFNHQTFQSVLYKDDICYSNNIADYSSADGTDDRMLFNHNETGKFDKGNLVFHRAMSLITIKLYHGKGFDKNSTTNFLFDTNKNIMMKGFNKTGLLNIKTGEWSNIVTGNWQTICNTDPTPITGGTAPAYTLLAFAIPGNDLTAAVESTNNPADALTISIDGNEYKVSKKDLYDAIAANAENCESGVANGTVKSDYLTDGNKLKAGINYEFSFIIGKKEIDAITAQIVDWETVTAIEQHPTNARIKLQLEERGSNIATTSNFSLFRSTSNYTEDGINDGYTRYDWNSGYTASASKTTPTYDTDHWKTDWFWESNKHFYHFRALGVANNSNPVVMSLPTPSVQNASDDYLEITSGVNYTDLCWGAPMLDDGDNETAGSFKWNYGPTTNGFDGRDDKAADAHQIYKAIGPTKNPVKLILFHMMSDLTFTIKTTTGADAVDLGDGSTRKTKVELVNYKTGGKVLLGNGLVQATGDATTAEISQNAFTAGTVSPAASAVAKYVYGAVPQDLTNVKLRITTPDHNQYIVDLKDMVVASGNITSNNIANPYSTNSSGKYIISRWYPGFKYNYSFTLVKTGITNLQATIVDWETVEADDETVKIQ